MSLQQQHPQEKKQCIGKNNITSTSSATSRRVLPPVPSFNVSAPENNDLYDPSLYDDYQEEEDVRLPSDCLPIVNRIAQPITQMHRSIPSTSMPFNTEEYIVDLCCETSKNKRWKVPTFASETDMRHKSQKNGLIGAFDQVEQRRTGGGRKGGGVKGGVDMIHKLHAHVQRHNQNRTIAIPL